VSHAYVDSSAFVKLFVSEPESQRLHAYLPQWPLRASCELLRVEAVRALRPHGDEHVARARAALATMRLVRLDERLLDSAGDLVPRCRSLDAIHLAAARSLGRDLGVVVTYDVRMAAAAAELGLPVAAP
jgi:predicted nucleic acid-binding protein